MKIKKIYFIIFSLFLLFIVGCTVDKEVTGKVFADLQKSTINNGETTTMHVDGKNTGDISANFILKIIPEDESKLIISYPGSLEDTLQPSENVGTKIIDVKGFTDHSSTTYWIKTQLIDNATNKVLDEKINMITVKK